MDVLLALFVLEGSFWSFVPSIVVTKIVIAVRCGAVLCVCRSEQANVSSARSPITRLRGGKATMDSLATALDSLSNSANKVMVSCPSSILREARD